MGGVSTPGGKGGDVELNLVPFIDLLSSLVLFLLLGAVWVQVAAINASVDTKGGRSTASNAPVKRLTVHLSKKGYELGWPASAPKNLPKAVGLKEGAFDSDALKTVIESIAKQDVVSSGAVSAEENVPYGDLIVALDSVKTGGITAVALSTN